MAPARRQALYRGCMDNDPTTMLDAPKEVREFFEELSEAPAWYSGEAARAGMRAFHANAGLTLQALAGGVLIEGFSTNISKSFVITGRLRDQGVTRPKQNNRHVLEIFLPNGLERYGDGWKLTIRIRLVHAQVRRLLKESPMWNAEAWGTPLSGAHTALGAAAFSARLLKHATTLGATYSEEERQSFMLTWRYAAHLLGTPEPMICATEREALHLYDIATTCEPPADLEAIVNAHALAQAIPQMVGITDEKERQALLRRVYRVSRALIGDQLADQLKYPKYRTTAVLPLIRLEERWNRIVDRIVPGRSGTKRLDTFSQLIAIAAYDERGISYAHAQPAGHTQMGRVGRTDRSLTEEKDRPT